MLDSFQIEPISGRRLKWHKGLCPICMRPERICFKTGEEPENAENATEEKNVNE